MEKDDLAVIFSHKTDEWTTPQWFFDKLNNVYSFTLDPASDGTNAKCTKYFTEQQNGLVQDWKGETVFINPPYSACYEWVKKAHAEVLMNKTTTVMLLPARTDTKWFHEFCMDKTTVDNIAFIKGRLKFGSQKNSAPFPSMVVVFKFKQIADEIKFSTLSNKTS